MGRVGIMLGSLWGHLGIVWVVLGSFEGYLGIVVQSCWDRCGDHFGNVFGCCSGPSAKQICFSQMSGNISKYSKTNKLSLSAQSLGHNAKQI